jgi:hypothetical protein
LGKIIRIEHEGDLDALRKIAASLVGKPCWGPRLTYPDTLILHIGDKFPYKHPSMANKLEGEWRINTMGTFWTLHSIDRLICSEKDIPQTVEKQVQAIANATITQVEIPYPVLGLILKFDNGCIFTILPTVEDDAYDNVPYWTLSNTPQHLSFEVGPKRILTIHDYKHS